MAEKPAAPQQPKPAVTQPPQATLPQKPPPPGNTRVRAGYGGPRTTKPASREAPERDK
jgi:hypothetical protein